MIGACTLPPSVRVIATQAVNGEKIEIVYNGSQIVKVSRDVSKWKRSESGWDLRLGNLIAFPRDSDLVFDPRKSNWRNFFEVAEMDEEGFVLERGKPYLLHTLECVSLPRGVVGLVNVKSTIARMFLVQPPTVVDGGFEGQIVLEIVPFVNVRIYPFMKFMHLVLVPANSTEGYSGRYQGQIGIVGPRTDGLW